MSKGTRVRVSSGDGGTFLGYGKYLGEATVYAIVTEEGSLLSESYAEEMPADEMVTRLGGQLIKIEKNPKIQMDNGTIVYGCQVWWDTATGGEMN